VRWGGVGWGCCAGLGKSGRKGVCAWVVQWFVRFLRGGSGALCSLDPKSFRCKQFVPTPPPPQHQPPQTQRQVSAFGSDVQSDGGDVWTIDWDTKAKYWKQDNKVCAHVCVCALDGAVGRFARLRFAEVGSGGRLLCRCSSDPSAPTPPQSPPTPIKSPLPQTGDFEARGHQQLPPLPHPSHLWSPHRRTARGVRCEAQEQGERVVCRRGGVLAQGRQEAKGRRRGQSSS